MESNKKRISTPSALLIAAIIGVAFIPGVASEHDLDNEESLGNCGPNGKIKKDPVADTWYTCKFTCVQNKLIVLHVETYIYEGIPPQKVQIPRLDGIGHAAPDNNGNARSCGDGTDIECGAGASPCIKQSDDIATNAIEYICHGKKNLGNAATYLYVNCYAKDKENGGGGGDPQTWGGWNFPTEVSEKNFQPLIPIALLCVALVYVMNRRRGD